MGVCSLSFVLSALLAYALSRPAVTFVVAAALFESSNRSRRACTSVGHPRLMPSSASTDPRGGATEHARSGDHWSHRDSWENRDEWNGDRRTETTRTQIHRNWKILLSKEFNLYCYGCVIYILIQFTYRNERRGVGGTTGANS